MQIFALNVKLFLHFHKKFLYLQSQYGNGALAERLGTGLQNLLQRFDSARHLKKPRSRYLGRGFALKSFLEVSYILQHLETRVRIYTISIDPDICEL